MGKYLVTGVTGRLGSIVARLLREANQEVRGLSRTHGVGLVSGDLETGRGIDAALAGVDTVVHCATGRDDAAAARILLAAIRRSTVAHLVVISIVGIDEIPFPYYRHKREVERLVADSGVPFTILRATQFHTFISALFEAQRWSPVVFAPALRVQSIDVGEVAARVVDLATQPPGGRVADFGGPEVRPLVDLARSWMQLRHGRRAILPLVLPGATFRAFRAGHQLTPDLPTGKIPFEAALRAAQQ